MRWGDSLKMLTEIWEETGIKPPALESRPALAQTWEIPYVVWLELTGSRNYTAGGAAQIPFSEFYFWATAHEYTRLEMRSMWEDVHVIDKVYLDVSDKFRKASEESTKKA